MNVVNDAWNAPMVDVAAIHDEAFRSCLAGLARVRRGEPDSILFHGPAGAGKTHLLARLQGHLIRTAAEAADGALHCVFVSVKLQANARTLWQFLRRRLAEDLMREHEGVTQLARLIAHQIAGARGEPARQWVRGLRVLPSSEDVSDLVDDVAGPLGLDRGLGVVLGHLLHRRNLAIARGWLRGESLSERDLAVLGVSEREPDNREEDARQVVTALCRLASGSLPMVFCFDQIEALQTSPGDRDSLFRFGRLASELSEADANILLISSIQSAVLELFDGSVRQSDRERAFRRKLVLHTLTPDQIEALVRSRLDSVPELRDLRAAHADNPAYPFAPATLATWRKRPRAVPRQIFSAAYEELGRLQELTAEPPPGPDDFLAMALARRRDAAVTDLKPGDSKELLFHGLPMLWDLRGSLLSVAEADEDVDFRAESPAPLAIAVCNETNMTSLAGRLRRLQKAAGEGGPALKIIRDARLPISRGAKKTVEYVKALERQGVKIVSPSIEALAALDALRKLLSDARAGDLARGGEGVSESTVRGWLTRNLDRALEELFEDLGEAPAASPSADPDQETLRALHDLLDHDPVKPLDEAAAELATDAARLRALALGSPDRVGVLHGPPAVLFLRVPAETLPAGGE